MRKLLDVKNLDAKIGPVRDTVSEVRDTARKVGAAAESQTTLNIALTCVCVSAMLIAVMVLVVSDREGD